MSCSRDDSRQRSLVTLAVTGWVLSTVLLAHACRPEPRPQLVAACRTPEATLCFSRGFPAQEVRP